VSYIFPILFALGTLALSDLGWVSAGELPWVVPSLVLAPYALAWLARRALLAGRFRVGVALERLLGIAPVLLQAVAIGGCGWLASLERWGFAAASVEDWPGVALLAPLAPFLVYQLVTIDARARALAFSPDGAGKVRPFQLRMFLSALLPLCVFLCGSTLVARSPEWRVRLEEVGLLGGIVATGLLAVFLYSMPFFLRYAWDTTPIERGWARRMLEDAARAAGFRYRELLVWNTGQQMSNAAIVGFSARSRFVFFSDQLLAQLGPRELAAVFAHEMGHARRAHAAVFGAFALGFFLSAQQLVVHFEVSDPLWGGAVLVTVVALWYLAFGYLSRRFELEADLESLRVVGESTSLIRALELVTGAHAHARSSWRHFSTKDRVAFLQAAERDPLVGIRLRLKLARWRKLGFTLFAVAALLQVYDLARAWDRDWLVADLRLGRFEAAAARADAPGVDEELARLAQRAAGVPAEKRGVRDLGARALDAWKRDNVKAALQWLELARLRGGRQFEPLIEALEGGATRSEDLPRYWQEALETIEQ